MTIHSVGSHGVADYWVINSRGKEEIVYEDPKETQDPPCEECGYSNEWYEIDLGMELEGTYDE